MNSQFSHASFECRQDLLHDFQRALYAVVLLLVLHGPPVLQRMDRTPFCLAPSIQYLPTWIPSRRLASSRSAKFADTH
jgi:hypothetical protein